MCAVHETSDFSNGCTSAGPHYNPFDLDHGAPWDEVRHVGSLGNIVANAEGVAEGVLIDRLVKLSGAPPQPSDGTAIGRSSGRASVHAVHPTLM